MYLKQNMEIKNSNWRLNYTAGFVDNGKKAEVLIVAASNTNECVIILLSRGRWAQLDTVTHTWQSRVTYTLSSVY